MASEVLMTISRDDVERARLMSEYKYELDTQSRIAYAWQDGEKQGRQQEKLETAGNLKSLGISIEQISSATGLSYDEIAKL